MRDVYATLKTLTYFLDNEYLQKYAQIVERNTRTPVRGKKTNKHHIIPKSWFKLNNLEINNQLNNLVNLPYQEHVLAHYYLCLCTEDPFKYANQLALMCLQSRKQLSITDKALLQTLPLYNNIYEDYTKKLKSNYKIYSSKR